MAFQNVQGSQPASSSWSSKSAGQGGGGSATVSLDLPKKQLDRLVAELRISPGDAEQIARNVKSQLTLTPNQLKTLAAATQSKERVYEAYGQAVKQLQGGKAPSWLDNRNKKGNIDFQHSAKGLDEMHLAEADYLYVSLRGQHGRTPEAQLNALNATLTNRPYVDIDADQYGWKKELSPQEKVDFVQKTYALRMATTQILAGSP